MSLSHNLTGTFCKALTTEICTSGSGSTLICGDQFTNKNDKLEQYVTITCTVVNFKPAPNIFFIIIEKEGCVATGQCRQFLLFKCLAVIYGSHVYWLGNIFPLPQLSTVFLIEHGSIKILFGKSTCTAGRSLCLRHKIRLFMISEKDSKQISFHPCEGGGYVDICFHCMLEKL